ncbi:MAG: low-specificity L-threonine aldolase [Actinobacteria bacterium]|nr:low-specificity L-threonine aldolase [Actinomycetota bacterium]NCG39012.1 low-specificity L-threonine aldolase [Actinomycetota bacterium]
MGGVIDLRSDTVTRPTEAMRAAMASAEVGDDVFGDDPSVNLLQDTVAERLGKEAALFVSSGTQSNLVALLAHCQRGDEYIAGDMAHAYRWEGGGGAVFGGIQPQPVPMHADGLPDPDTIDSSVKPDDHHFARTKLLCLENTKDGHVQSVDRMREATLVGRKHNLSIHLDGARMWNGVVDLGISAQDFTSEFDTVSMCLSKGLGAPVGSVLSGPADIIHEAHKWRKMSGGAMRQAGVLAAAGLHALDNHVDRLADDHANAARLAEGLGNIDGITVVDQATNMVFIEVDGDEPALQDQLLERGIRTVITPTPRRSLARLVCHLDVSKDDVETSINAFAELAAT